MSSTPIAVVEMLLELPPLHIMTELETLAGMHRLHCNEPCKPTILGYGHIKVAWVMNKEPVFVEDTDKIIPPNSFHKPFSVIFPRQGEWKGRIRPGREGV
jgi:hypothetical protein